MHPSRTGSSSALTPLDPSPESTPSVQAVDRSIHGRSIDVPGNGSANNKCRHRGDDSGKCGNNCGTVAINNINTNTINKSETYTVFPGEFRIDRETLYVFAGVAIMYILFTTKPGIDALAYVGSSIVMGISYCKLLIIVHPNTAFGTGLLVLFACLRTSPKGWAYLMGVWCGLLDFIIRFITVIHPKKI